jgi:hypothetical protein
METTTIHRKEKNLMEQFLSDPRTSNLRKSHLTSVHVAILVKRGKVIAQASNKVGSRSHGSGYSDYTIHAERNVIKDLGDISQLRGADMYIMRLSKDHAKTGFDRFMGSKPCPECQVFLEKCMREYGLKNVLFTAD